jgi:hypothetical protein
VIRTEPEGTRGSGCIHRSLFDRAAWITPASPDSNTLRLF